MSRYEVSFVAEVEVEADTGPAAASLVQHEMERLFGFDNVGEFNLTKVELLRQCVCCREVIHHREPWHGYCEECMRCKCDACVEDVRRLLASESA